MLFLSSAFLLISNVAEVFIEYEHMESYFASVFDMAIKSSVSLAPSLPQEFHSTVEEGIRCLCEMLIPVVLRDQVCECYWKRLGQNVGA